MCRFTNRSSGPSIITRRHGSGCEHALLGLSPLSPELLARQQPDASWLWSDGNRQQVARCWTSGEPMFELVLVFDGLVLGIGKPLLVAHGQYLRPFGRLAI